MIIILTLVSGNSFNVSCGNMFINNSLSEKMAMNTIKNQLDCKEHISDNCNIPDQKLNFLF